MHIVIFKKLLTIIKKKYKFVKCFTNYLPSAIVRPTPLVFLASGVDEWFYARVAIPSNFLRISFLVSKGEHRFNPRGDSSIDDVTITCSDEKTTASMATTTIVSPGKKPNRRWLLQPCKNVQSWNNVVKPGGGGQKVTDKFTLRRLDDKTSWFARRTRFDTFSRKWVSIGVALNTVRVLIFKIDSMKQKTVRVRVYYLNFRLLTFLLETLNLLIRLKIVLFLLIASRAELISWPYCYVGVLPIFYDIAYDIELLVVQIMAQWVRSR